MKSRILDMQDDMTDQLRKDLKGKEFSIQLDESVDITDHAQLMIFIKYLKDDSFVEELLACRELKTTTTGRDIMKVVSEVFKDFGLLWKNCIQVCTDGAPAMSGRFKGFVTLVIITPKCHNHTLHYPP